MRRTPASTNSRFFPSSTTSSASTDSAGEETVEMATNTRNAIADHVTGSIRNADYMALTERYAPDALLDMNLPTWRFQLQGPDAIKQYFTEQTATLPNLHCTQLRELVTEDAIAVESECRFVGPDGEYLWRCID